MAQNATLTGKVVLIVGAGRPLGRLLALGFARAGAKLALHDLSPVHLDETAAQVQALGAESRCYTGDVGKGLPCRALISDVLDDWQQLDVLVTCLQAEPPAGLLQLDEWDWTRTLELNLSGPFLLAQAAAPVMIEQGGGAIIFIQSDKAAEPSPAFSASQAGLNGLALAAAAELLPYNIKSYAVDAGDLGTAGDALDPASLAALQLQAKVVYLCTPAAVNSAGQGISLD
ncbi:MAG TPA: SDR family NAD(P)-dependent oxidoreductase [Xanthomonadales bacterium]|nr:SDR family NAD(P)-dependent oxidoreductase [Xanthomonadales bacterium]